MSKWQKLLGGAFLLAIIAMASWFFIKQYISSVTETNTNNSTIANTNTSIPENIKPPQPVAMNSDEASLRSLSLFFASRFGSYSSASNFSNLKEINYLLTENMRSWAESYINSNTNNLGYYSVATRGLSSNIQEKTDFSAQVVVGTQRQEIFTVAGEPQITYQNLLLKFIKQGEDWKVDDAVWQK